MSARLKALAIGTLLALSGIAKAQRMPYTNQTDAGIFIGTPLVTSFSLQTFNGITIRKWNVDAGVVTGVDLYEQVIILPVSAGFKWNPLRAQVVSPFIGLNGGYGFALPPGESDDFKYQGGFILNPSIGLRIKTASSAKINAAFGFRQQGAVISQSFASANFDYFGTPPEFRDQYKFRRLTFSLGVSF